MSRVIKTVSIDSFSGLDNTTRPEKTGSKYLKVAENVDVTTAGQVIKREGYTKEISGNFHSLYSNDEYIYCVKDNNLVKIDQDNNVTVLKSSVGPDRISFEDIDGKVYFSSKSNNGVIDNGTVRSWGIARPNPSPSLSATTGALSPGKYQINITFVSDDGRESGAGVARTINLASGGGISITNIPTSSDSTVEKVRIYCSPPDGDILYWISDVANGTTSAKVLDINNAVFPLRMFNLMEAPLGTTVKYFSGRVYVAIDNVLWYSEAFDYEHFNFQKNFIQFEEGDDVVAVMPVENGLWVATSKAIYWLHGRNPEQFRVDLRESVQSVAGTEQRIQGAYIFIQNTPLGYKWLITTNKGVFCLFNDGVVMNLTYRAVAYPKALEGGSLFMETENVNKYISTLKNPGDTQMIGASDLVTATVIRNGIPI